MKTLKASGTPDDVLDKIRELALKKTAKTRKPILPKKSSASTRTEGEESPPTANLSEMASDLERSVPTLKGKTEVQGDQIRINAPGGTLDAKLQSPEFFAEYAAKYPEQFSESAKKRGIKPEEATSASLWDGETLHIRSDAWPEEIVHDLIHAMEDRGVVTPKEIDLLGGREGAAYFAQDWVALGKPSAHGRGRVKDTLARIWDSARALTGSTKAQQRQLTRRIVERLGIEAEAARATSHPGEFSFSTRYAKWLDKVYANEDEAHAARPISTHSPLLPGGRTECFAVIQGS